jgi:hypothetical protein
VPAIADLEELREVDARVKEFQSNYPEAYGSLVELIKKYRKVGYRNLAKLLLNESTPEKLKGGDAGA